MRKTSIFFLIISVVLIFTGYRLLDQASAKADKKGIELFSQELLDNGDLVETVEFSPEEINRMIITLKDADINIIGGSEKCYVEIVNFNTIEYSAFTSNKAFNIDTDFFSAIIGRAESGKIKFNGIRDYVRNDEHNSEKKINIYLSDITAVKQFNINLKNGNVTVDNMGDLICDYTITLNSGNVTFSNTKQISLINAQVKNGDVTVNNTYVVNTEVSIENGNLNITSPSNVIYDYDVENEAGKININSESYTGRYTLANETPNGMIKAHIGVGNITVSLVDTPINTETTPENAETTNSTTEQQSE